MGTFYLRKWRDGQPIEPYQRCPNVVTEYGYRELVGDSPRLPGSFFGDGGVLLATDLATPVNPRELTLVSDIGNVQNDTTLNWTGDGAQVPSSRTATGFLPVPPSPITFSALAIARATGTNNQVYAITTGITEPVGGGPRVQDGVAFEVIYVYSIDVLESKNVLDAQALQTLGRRIGSSDAENLQVPLQWWQIPPASGLLTRPGVPGDSANSSGWAIGTANLLKQRFVNLGLTNSVGEVVAASYIGRWENASGTEVALASGFSLLSGSDIATANLSIYPGTTSRPGPFQNLATYANGGGIPILSGTSTFDCPTVLEILIVSATEFRLRTLRAPGVNGNSYQRRGRQTIAYNPTTQAYATDHGDASVNYIGVSDTRICSWDAAGVAIKNIFTLEIENVDAASSPAQAWGGIRQVSSNRVIVNAGEITAATSLLVSDSTGLYEIDLTAGNAITQLSSDDCYGADYSSGGVIFAVFSDRIASSADNFTANLSSIASFTFTDTIFLRASRQNDECFIANSGGSKWFSASTLAAGFNAPAASLVDTPNRVEVTPLAGTWLLTDNTGLNTRRALFGSPNFASNHPRLASPVSLGSDGYYVFPNTSTIFNNDGTVAASNITIIEPQFGTANYSAFDSFVIYMGGALAYVGQVSRLHEITPILRGSALSFTEYGWNSSAWVVGDPGNQTIGSSVALLGGLTANFDDRGASTPWVQDDIFSAPIARGLFKSNVDTVAYANYIIPAPFKADVAINGGVAVPVSAPYEVTATEMFGDAEFLRFFTQNEFILGELHTPLLNGGAPAAIRPAGTTVAPNEIVVEEDRFVFDASNAGQVLTGTGSYLTIS